MSLRPALLPVAVLIALSACGRVADLEPAPGHQLPPKPAMARTTPTPDELLTPPPFAAPDRVDELMKRSQPRRADRFDLPPPAGGEAPEPPPETDPVDDAADGPSPS